MSLISELSEWASALRLDDVPQPVIDVATSQLLSQLAAVRAGAAHPLGQALTGVFGPLLQSDPRQSASVLSGVSAWLHFDDTAYAGHLSNSTVTVPVAFAYALGLDGERLLTAIIAANECAARITAATSLGPFRGQSATHTHIAGAIAGSLAARQAPTGHWINALALGFALPPRTLSPGFLGSDAKTVSATVPVRAGLDACDFAAAGLVGVPDILERPAGFLSRFSDIPLPEAVVLGLGQRWHTETLSFKVHPGGPGIDAAVDCALELHEELGSRVSEIVDIAVEASLYTVFTDHNVKPYVTGPDSPVSALVFSTPYAVASALLTGSLTQTDFAPPAVAEPARWELADRVRLTHDRAMTRELFLSDVPFGEALRLAGPRAEPWLRGFGAHVDGDGQWLVDLVGAFGPGAPDFASAAKATPARVTVRLADGSELSHELTVPVGAIGSPQRTDHAGLVRAKFLGTGGSAEAADRLGAVAKLSSSDLAEALELALTPADGTAAGGNP